MAPDVRERIQHKARQTNSFGPCPLLEDGACLMYDARALICRTHGLPMATEYRGQRAIGFCEKNFQYLSPIPEEDIIDLTRLNSALADVNQRYVRAAGLRISAGKRFPIGETMLMGVIPCNLSNTPVKPLAGFLLNS
jgi:hypothetical protein